MTINADDIMFTDDGRPGMWAVKLKVAA